MASSNKLKDFESTQALLSKYGLKSPKQDLAASEEQALVIANKIGLPVVLKIAGESITHKTDVGGVQLNLHDEIALCKAYGELVERFPSLENEGGERVLVQKMAYPDPPVELIFGAKRDPTFGCVLLFGVGGVMTELNRDVTMCVEPWSDHDIRAMFERIRMHQLLEGFRGSKKFDKEDLFYFAKGVGELIKENREIVEIDLNPVIQDSDGEILALDSKIKVDEAFSRIPKGIESADSSVEQTKYFLEPRNIAVVGASNDPNKVGGMVLPRLLKFGFDKSHIFPVNPGQNTISEIPSYKTIDSIPGAIDLACVCVQAPAVPTIIDDLGKKGTKCAIIFSSGFSESGNDSLQQLVKDKAREERVRLLGPNSEGAISSFHCIFASFSHRFDYLESLPRGPASIVSQSGGILTDLAVSLVESGAGFCNLFSVGNEADLTVSDILQFYAIDPQTRAVGAFIEGIRDGPKFVEAAKALLHAGKPLIVYKGGKSSKGAKAAGLHTGALAGSYDVFKTISAQLGIIEAETLEEIGDVLTALTFQPLPRGNRLVVASASGGVNTIVADWCDANSIYLPEFGQSTKEKLGKIMPELGSSINPVDFPAQTMGAPAVIRDTLEVLADEGDIILVILIGGAGFAKAYADLCSPITSRGKPLITCWLSPRGVNEDARRILLDRRLPVYSSPTECMKVIRAMIVLSKSTKS
jgi:acetate---CoA ligase (ADP-forming)